jgi:hypothetical protein
MRTPAGVVAFAACVIAALAPSVLPAEEIRRAEPPPSLERTPDVAVRPRIADFKATLDENDEIAALEAVRVALSEVGDGNTYVWYRRHGRLSGLVQPTASFKDRTGRVCRHILLIMTTGGYTARAEGVACRLDSGRWQLEG